MGSAGASSKPIQDPPKFDFQAPPAIVKTSMEGTEDQSKPKREQLSNPGTMEELNKRTKGNPVDNVAQSLSDCRQKLISFRGYRR
jgi:hypothetical protein